MEEIRGGQADRVLHRLVVAAAGEGASDIHIEPMRSFVRVRFRKDGRLYDRCHLPLSMAKSLAVRAKVVAHMDVGESRLPQDGSFSETLDGVSYDFRVSLLPSLYGETMVVRVLSSEVAFIEENDLGMLPEQKEIFAAALRRRQGLILTTGPTGSGKTSTLYAALKLLNRGDVSIVSIEDPVEYRVPGVTQVEVNEKAGLTFGSGLRSLLRQDPDIILVGEIRDKETAEIAIHAALTGHLVLSTLHTDKAASAPLRLMDMGIPAYLLSASLSLIMAQRLVRTLCPFCREEMVLTEPYLHERKLPASLAGKTAYTAAGCPRCQEGTSGRTGVFELISIGKKERLLIHDGFSVSRLAESAAPTMGGAALSLMLRGRIPPDEAALVAAGEV